VTLQPRDKTMTDPEIEAVAAKIVAEVGKRTGGVLRALMWHGAHSPRRHQHIRRIGGDSVRDRGLPGT